MNRAGVLLDTGPLVALLCRRDVNHARAKAMFEATAPPFRCPEAVVAESCFLMRKVDPLGPAEVIALGRKGVFEVAFPLGDHWAGVESILRKYADRPVSLADACLIRGAELFSEPRICTFDADFRVYRWAKHRRFQLI